MDSVLLPKRGVIFTKGKGLGIKFLLGIQSIFTNAEYGIKSNWNHVVLKIDNYIYESTVGKVRNGTKKFLFWKIKKYKKIRHVLKTDVNKWCSKITRKKFICVGIQKDHKLSPAEWKKIKAHAVDHIARGTKYAFKELRGTMARIIKYRLTRRSQRAALMQEHNKHDSDKVYCIAFVADCMEASGKEYMDVAHCVSVVDEGWIDSKIPCNNSIIRI